MQPWKKESTIQTYLQGPIYSSSSSSYQSPHDLEAVYDEILRPVMSSFEELEYLVREHSELLYIVRARAHFFRNIKSVPRATHTDDYEAHKALQIWRVMTPGTHKLLGEGDPRCLLTITYHELVVLLYEALMPVKRHSYFMTGKAEVIKRIRAKALSEDVEKRHGVDQATFERLMGLPYIIAVNYANTGQIICDRFVKPFEYGGQRVQGLIEPNESAT